MTELLARTDPRTDHAPLRIAPASERVLHLHLSNPWEPQNSLVEALQSLGRYVQIDWPNMPREILQQRVLDAAKTLQPTLVFMQLQRRNVIRPETIDKLRETVGGPRLVIATWTGDVTTDNGLLPHQCDWVTKLNVDVALHTSMTHVKAWREQGIDAAYLQIGWCEDRYKPHPAVPQRAYKYDVVFLGQAYENWTFEEVLPAHERHLRKRVADAMRAEFSDRFGLFGGGWPGCTAVSAADSCAVYHSARSALNISWSNEYEMYSSDRLFRILASGTPALVKTFPGMAGLGLQNGYNCLTWNTPEEAVNAARTGGDIEKIGWRGHELAQEHRWSVRMRELAVILRVLRGESLDDARRPW